ncbi:GntR family transcriptional regulator [Nitratireductor rhodophyticola]|uniref:GntR family transcriptional regulator n=1 Tax=Nitratireductor rhodophyticola TaxID=2854036 RepID=UPI00300846BB
MGADHAYQRLASRLIRELTGGLWRNGDPLPSEHALASAYAVSRRTVRQALELLQHEGFVSKGQGRSTVYRERAIGRSGEKLVDFPTAAREAGFRPSTRLISTGHVEAGLSIAHALSVPLGSEVFEIRRVRLLEGRPVVHQTSLLPAALAEKLDVSNLAETSLYTMLRAALGGEIFLAREHVSLLSASEEEAEALSIPKASPLLRVQRVVVDGKGRAVEYSNSALQDSFFRF